MNLDERMSGILLLFTFGSIFYWIDIFFWLPLVIFSLAGRDSDWTSHLGRAGKVPFRRKEPAHPRAGLSTRDEHAKTSLVISLESVVTTRCRLGRH